MFRDKPAGLVVGYIGLAQNLKSALQQYSQNDKDNTGVDDTVAIAMSLASVISSASTSAVVMALA